MARGFTAYGIDYDDTFAPVAKIRIVRTLIAVAIVQQQSLYEMDVTNAFLHVVLTEEVYIQPLLGFLCLPSLFVDFVMLSMVVSRCHELWFERFRHVVLDVGFTEF